MPPSPAQTWTGTAAGRLERGVIDRLPERTFVFAVHVGPGQADVLEDQIVEARETAALGAMAQPSGDTSDEIAD